MRTQISKMVSLLWVVVAITIIHYTPQGKKTYSDVQNVQMVNGGVSFDWVGKPSVNKTPNPEATKVFLSGTFAIFDNGTN